jgi:hypothetical protein
MWVGTIGIVEEPMHTQDLLADALREAGLTEMADRAATGFYHDFLSPLDLPEMALVTALGAAATAHPDKAQAIEALRKRVINGEFDASAEEGEEWAASPDGQETFGKLIRGQ